MDKTSATGNKKMNAFSKNSSILIKVNGEDKLIPQNTTILKLLEHFNINKERVVIELNREIISKNHFENAILHQEDKLEIVTFVGGG